MEVVSPFNCKHSLNLKSSTLNCMIYTELEWYPLLIDMKQRMLSYWTKLVIEKQSKYSFAMYVSFVLH